LLCSFWNLYLARKDAGGELVLSQVPTCGGRDQATANKVCRPDQFCLTGELQATETCCAPQQQMLLQCA
jgi:hypothetical protein